MARTLVAVDDKRAAILAAALELFSEQTYGGTPMPAIAERAGVGAGTIYRYFASKEELANAVYRDAKLALQRCLSDNARSGSPRQELTGLWRGLWEFWRKSPNAFRFLETQHHELYLEPASRAVSDAVAQSAADFVRRGQAAGALRAGDPVLLIALAFGAFVGLVKECDQKRLTLDEDAFHASEAAVWAMLAA